MTMKTNNEPKIYLCYPKGYEERTAAVIALSELEAKQKCLRGGSIKEAVQLLGAELMVTCLTDVFGKQGYEIFIQRSGNYH